MSRYNTSAQKHQLKYHIELYSKSNNISSIASYIENSFNYTADNSHITLYNIYIEKHIVTLEISFSPQYSLNQTIKRLKESSRNYLWKHNEKQITDLFKNKTIWCSGYFCKTISFI